jgi:hypothetical protein
MRIRFAKAFLPSFVAAALLLPAAPAQALSLGGLFGSPVDSELAAQVPQNKREAINAADYALACANQDVELAKLKEELADRQDDLASQNTKLAKAQARAAEINLDIAKQEAIMQNGLGKAEDNRKVMNDLLADRTKNEAERIQYKSKVDQATLFVRDWTNRVAAKEKTVAEFKSRRSGADAATPPAVAKPAAQPSTAPADEPTVIINKEPGAPPAQPAVTPEADLKN